ncbi:MAG: hypothetical protein A2651_03925 [Candidatus Yanofskybacteria bacterium RIFCSPHIGHO2_01_FULL_42_12]|uniref:Uncharacterized protein n=1 Tax=Candidatus Yanofskybacteria bacterium RIFCSPLOWO2_01_FULL_42_49 TaxID=1802694 RepID=A0A1F8GAB3_9BACT|nr:MAG: hypothetical protein A2651_03925 [Candidatus Yanofskybacteria bacterium RIFCSPHIGHO2_01_FULL_42_12]OGN22314.1 MAG: hypothetical protein A2918_00125 [Candidatus Yanofskybacteria bacterium RIFCSPLOWO2_01_FULL_42_49]
MFYILGLFIILGLILGGFTGSLPFSFSTAGIAGAMGNVLGNFKDKTYEFIFPKSGNEILIDNLNSNYSLLDRFFSQPTADAILKSKDIPENEKEVFKKAVEAFKESKDQVEVLGASVVKNEPSIFESLIKKTFDIILPGQKKESELAPTYIPPSCRLECSE